MAGRRKKAKRKGPPKPRDPFWRARRALGERKVASKLAYRRGANRRIAREAEETGGDGD